MSRSFSFHLTALKSQNPVFFCIFIKKKADNKNHFAWLSLSLYSICDYIRAKKSCATPQVLHEINSWHLHFVFYYLNILSSLFLIHVKLFCKAEIPSKVNYIRNQLASKLKSHKNTQSATLPFRDCQLNQPINHATIYQSVILLDCQSTNQPASQSTSQPAN